jgi:hypothetical protein
MEQRRNRMKILSRIENESYPRKINFGCGNDFLEGYLNIDSSYIINGRDGYWVAKGLLINPQVLPNNYFEKIEAKMVLEHIHLDIIPSVIYTMSCLLKEKGTVHVIVPNFEYFAINYPVYTCPEAKFGLSDLSFLREVTFQLLDPMLSTDNISYRGHQSLWTPNMANFWFRSEGFEIKFLDTKSPILEFVAVKKDKFSISLEV